ncbi:MAG: protein-methionine-sulfoxide reductase catalytic subunit MsrP [Proteobacteria bacterium]|nr:protein-methionine-sulfoxide reductase catalytic subunit MsrP [Pseudomonadota bacterium]
MFIKRKKGWELPDSAATPEAAYKRHSRRRLLATGAAGVVAIGAGAALWMSRRGGSVPQGTASTTAAADAQTAEAADPSTSLYPAMRNMRYRLDREITDEKVSTTYNNFYEFGSSKNIWQAAQRLPIRPWEIRIDGKVEKERTVGIDDLLKAVSLEERVYRHRCVEAWAMAVPWTGFPMKDLVAFAKPLSAAKFVRMETFNNPDVAPGLKASWYPWPYIEGLTIEEATNELAFLATGIYGKPVVKQMGAPLRLVTPWKYGFKSIKSIVRFTFTEERPKSFWEVIQGSEYGFWANVNPKVPHPRWSQATEELIGTNGTRVPTQLFNGYGDFVAQLYADKQSERLWT